MRDLRHTQVIQSRINFTLEIIEQIPAVRLNSAVCADNWQEPSKKGINRNRSEGARQKESPALPERLNQP